MGIPFCEIYFRINWLPTSCLVTTLLTLINHARARVLLVGIGSQIYRLRMFLHMKHWLTYFLFTHVSAYEQLAFDMYWCVLQWILSFDSTVNTGLHCVSYRPWCFCFRHFVYNFLDLGSSKIKNHSEKVLYIKKSK